MPNVPSGFAVCPLACKVFCNSLTACPLSPFVRLLLLTGADLDCTGCFCSVTEVSFVIGSEPGPPLAEAPPASIEEKTNAVASVVETKYFLTEDRKSTRLNSSHV